MQHIDLYISFLLFFVLGALVNSLIRMVLDYKHHKQKQRDDRLDRIEETLREMRYGQIDNG